MKEIVQDGAKVLRETAKPVPDIMFGSAELEQLIRDLSETLDAQIEGVAIAAPQIGVSYRLFVVRIDRTLSPNEQTSESEVIPQQTEVFINPEIIKSSRRHKSADEGCLSVKGVYGTTKRHERITIRAKRPDGSTTERGAGGLLAQIFQHEVDHLNGILFTDTAENLLKIEHDVKA